MVNMLVAQLVFAAFCNDFESTPMEYIEITEKGLLVWKC